MKHKAPQPEFKLPGEPFALVPETAVDGARQVQASATAEVDRAEAASRQTLADVFGPPVHVYGRGQAIEDGVLVDLMQPETESLVREAGFKYPIAMTVGAWTAAIGPIQTEGEPDVPLPPGQDLKGRLWDVLWMLKRAIARTAGGDRVAFDLLVSRRKVRLWSLCGPGDKGEPVITIMLPGED
jgi:hypothetical protein